jgi:DNA processing protein
MTETEAFIVLNMLRGLGPVRVRRLLAAFGSPQAILAARKADLRAIDGIGADVADSIASWESQADLNDELNRIAAVGARVITTTSSEYPPLLREIHDPPTVLYIQGGLLDRDRHAIGIVGTRKPSHYASDCAKKLSYQLAYAGLTIVSGLARGIDTAAHQAALAAQGRTIAVLGSGLEALYPPENRTLADKIAASGAVITEFAMSVQADRQTFPMRNRIISGMSIGLLVVEAGAKSGALISANQAGEQGRSIYAIPGRIDQAGSLGSNRLIQQGAKLVLSAQDILDDFGLLFPAEPEITPIRAVPVLDGEQLAVYNALAEDETGIDELVAKCGLPTQTVSSTLLALEMRRLVKQLPGQRFVKIN